MILIVPFDSLAISSAHALAAGDPVRLGIPRLGHAEEPAPSLDEPPRDDQPAQALLGPQAGVRGGARRERAMHGTVADQAQRELLQVHPALVQVGRLGPVPDQ